MISFAAIALVVAVVAVVVTALSVVQVRRVNRRFQVLDDIAQVVDRGGTQEETHDTIAPNHVPQHSDFCVIDLIEDG
ncbi:MAG: hypothetical protein ACTHLH_09750, partial [Solirubrobacterales bacterium]